MSRAHNEFTRDIGRFLESATLILERYPERAIVHELITIDSAITDRLIGMIASLANARAMRSRDPR